MSDVRVRIAPSPTGNLHVGTVRTALFNYMFAKKNNGKFILRIEDTDTERSEQQYVDNILAGLRALNLQWDEGPEVGGDVGPYFQTQRTDTYQEWLDKLLESGDAYKCYMTDEELAEERKKAEAANRGLRSPYRDREYNGAKDGNYVVRFKVPENTDVVVNDLIRGEIKFESNLMPDFVICKSSGMPTYTFCNVIDDTLMKISHVIRGEDLLPNTPNQVLIYQALGLETPKFAHLSLILSPDKSKLSKRHGATSIVEFMEQGYLPEAMTTYLAQLGWSSPVEDETQTLSDFCTQFDFDRVSSSPAVFDYDKLKHINAQTLRGLPDDELLSRVTPFLTDYDLEQLTPEKLNLMLSLVKERVSLLSEVSENVIYFFGENIILDAQLVGEVLTGEDPSTVLKAFQSQVIETANWDSIEDLSEKLKTLTENLKPMKTKIVMWSIRAALTGRTNGVDLGKTLYILGKKRCQTRVETALGLVTA